MVECRRLALSCRLEPHQGTVVPPSLADTCTASLPTRSKHGSYRVSQGLRRTTLHLGRHYIENQCYTQLTSFAEA
jgi:hypothetical protein